LFDDVTNGVGDRGLEHHALGLEARKVHTNDLARLEHHKDHPTLSEVKRKRRTKWQREAGRNGQASVGSSKEMDQPSLW
jgi:hypothetical protein